MTPLLPAAKLGHIAATRKEGDAAFRVLSPQDFAKSRAEITQWEGYAPTPLVCLSALAAAIGVGEIHYKHEGPRFGLGSFKALGGSYAALRVLQRQISAKLGQEVSLEDIRLGKYKDEAARITLVSATDGNHGRSLAWGCQRFGAPCRIYIHAEVSEGRAEAMRDLGAEVIRITGDYDASVVLAKTEAEENGWFVVSDTSWPGYSEPPRDVMAGYGVMTREICEALEQPHVLARGLVETVDHPTEGAIRLVRGPIRFDGQGASPATVPSLLGQDSRNVLSGALGLDEAAIDALVAKGIVGTTG